MTVEEKIKLCEGEDFWKTKDFSNYGIPSMFMCDGPHGVRKQDDQSDHLGVYKSIPATCFPTAVSTACSWDVELLGKIGAAIASEAVEQGVGVFLGPGVNMKRNPLCGRNFEYFSEDPYLAGTLAAAFIKSAQKNGIGTSLKHFACNEQEYKRFHSDSVLDERTLREIYLAAFEIAVREGKPKTVMSAYNKINGVYCCDSKDLLTHILRDEWGFDGLVVTDWGGMHDRVAGFQAGCDLVMPGGSNYMLPEVLDAVSNGALSEATIDRSVKRIKKMVTQAQEALKNPASCDYDSHHTLARIAAEQSAVLLKNEDGLLPLNEKQALAVVGDMAQDMRYQGAGSSRVNPTRVINPADVLKSDTRVEKADVAVVFAGLPPAYESEGFDRDNMHMPEAHIRLIEETAAKNPNTVVVLFCGSPIEAPWADKVKAILYMGLPGQAGGEAVKNLLYGNTNPSGKLAESWPFHYSDCPSHSYYSSRDGQYREGIYVGYRYYDKAGIPPRWRFGFGLSYTQFAYTDPMIQDENIHITVTNTGKRAGGEVIQLYIAPPHTGIHRPIRELKRYKKVFLQPNESIQLSFELDERCFAIWHNGWSVPAGTYHVLIGGNPCNLIPAGRIEKNGETIEPPPWQANSWYEKPNGSPSQDEWERMLGRKFVPYKAQKGKFSSDDSIVDMKEHSFVMRIMYWAVHRAISKGAKPGTAEYRMLMESSAGSPLRTMQISGGLKSGFVNGLLSMANGTFFRGLRIMMKGG